MLDTGVGASNLLPPAIVVGRTLSSYFVGRHPEQPGDDHLHRLQRAGRPRDRGLADDDARTGRDAFAEHLDSSPTRAARTWPGAWGRSRVRPGQRHADGQPGQPDAAAARHGAQAFATLDAGAVSAATPAATLQPGNRLRSQPARLHARRQHHRPVHPGRGGRSSTTTRQQIFNFLHTQIGYNSYIGSVRGARARSGRVRATRSTSPAWAWP